MKPLLINLAIFFIFSVNTVYSQDCLDIPPVEGSSCMTCAPDDWDQLPTPDMVDNTGSWQFGACTLNMPGPIPNGNTASLFVGASWGSEGISTVVNGLVPGLSYSLGFYWTSISSYDCGGIDNPTDPSTLLLTIGNEVYEYDGALEWEYHELCFEVEDEEIEIIATNTAVPTLAVLLFDIADCSIVTSCCALLLSVDELEYDVCPGDEILFDIDYVDEAGPVSASWTSIPESAIDYLSDPNTLNPVFVFPYDYPVEEQTIEYTITIEDDLCRRSETLYVTVHQNIKPDFDIELCEIYEPIFPDISSDLFTGTWSGNFDLEGLGGTVQNFTFTLDGGQDNCTEEWIYELDVEYAVELDFEFTKDYCQTDNNLYPLPYETIRGYEGEWDIDEFIPAQLAVGSHAFIFTAYPEEVCAYEYILEINILSLDTLLFELPSAYCETIDTLLLPDTSIMGISGQWSESYIDLSLTGLDTFTFTALDGCYDDYTYTFSVAESIQATFNIPDSICDISENLILDAISVEGYSGVWLPSEINFDTITDPLIEVTWYPDSIYDCLIDTTIAIIINEPAIPTFNLINDFCINFGEYNFPTQSNEGIEGSWLTEVIETQSLNPGIYTNTFYPVSGSCADSINVQFTISELQNTIFNLQQAFCTSEAPYELPSESDNGITGSWSIQEIDPSTIADSIIVNFIPDDGQCSAIYSDTLYILENIDPVFDYPDVFCAQGQNFIFASESENGISGMWTATAYDPESFVATTFTNTFTPDNSDCFNTIDIAIPVIDFSNLIVDLISSESCDDNSGYINIQHDSLDIIFSLDNGNEWIFESSNDINIEPGTHEILVQDVDGLCQISIEIMIDGLTSPAIEYTEIQFVSDCGLNDGIITVFALGTNLEYSLNGIDWENSTTFNNLTEGAYTVYVRDEAYHDCTDSVVVMILSPPEIAIIDFMSINPSDCEGGLGEAIIFVDETNVEFSIDGGVTWQASNNFTDLDPGDYTVIVRYEGTFNCTDELSFSIVRPACVGCEEIGISYETHPVDCLNPISGSALITDILGPDTVTYNIIWENNVAGLQIDNLTEGWHYLEIEYGDDCMHFDSVFVESVDPISFDLLSFDQSCQELGSIEITNFMGGSGTPMYSIDGINFQDDAVFTNLSADEYQVLVETLFNCNADESIVISDHSDLQIDIPGVQAIQLGDTTTLNPLINQNTIDDFEWSPQEGIINPGDLIIQVSPAETMTYTLTIYFGDCVESRSVTVEVTERKDVYIPDIFTPNGDGSNDTFYIMGAPDSNFSVEQMHIYDRWGNLVFTNYNFEINNSDAGWNGTFNDSDAALGVYVYMIVLNVGGDNVVRAGNVTLVR